MKSDESPAYAHCSQVHMQMLKFSETTTVGKGHVLNMDNFIDTTNIEGRFEFSEWVRAYGKYLDEQLEVYQKISFYQVSLLLTRC